MKSIPTFAKKANSQVMGKQLETYVADYAPINDSRSLVMVQATKFVTGYMTINYM